MATCTKIKKFFTPDNSLHLFELLVAVILTSVTFGWEEKGIKYSDLNSGDYDQASSIVFFNFVTMLTLIILACIVIYCMVSSPKLLSSQTDIVSSGGLSVMMLIATSVLAHAISRLGGSRAVQEAGLHFQDLQAAVVFGLTLTILLASSAGLSLHHHLRRREHIMFRDSRSMTDLPDDIPT